MEEAMVEDVFVGFGKSGEVCQKPNCSEEGEKVDSIFTENYTNSLGKSTFLFDFAIKTILSKEVAGRQQHERPAVVQPKLPHERDSGSS
jgi:hypothetical protein